MARPPAFRAGRLPLRDGRGKRHLSPGVRQRERSRGLRRGVRGQREASRGSPARVTRPASATEIALESLRQIVFPEFYADPQGVAVFSGNVEIRRDAIVVVKPLAQLA